MSFQIKFAKKLSVALLVVGFASIAAMAQDLSERTPGSEVKVAGDNDLYCAGYIQYSQVDEGLEIVGAEKEEERQMYTNGDLVFLNEGANAGVNVGDEYSIIRPKGEFKSKFSKKGKLGIYVQEVGALVVEQVKNQFSIARVRFSCSAILLGDLLQPTVKRTSPVYFYEKDFDRFANSSGKATGHIVLARDGLEMLARGTVVYIDLGREDGVSKGDALRIFRPLGEGNLFNEQLAAPVNGTDGGYESERWRGGKFSNQTGRKQGKNADKKVLTPDDARKDRPEGMRRVIGEMVVLNVLEKTATAIIVRSNTEVETGDMIEVK